MKIISIVESVPGNFNQRFFVEIINDGHVISRGSQHTHCEEGKEMESAARNAVYNLRALADGAERTLIAMGILKEPVK